MAVILKYIPLISPLLVILGWLIINLQNNHRETRKEVRGNINIIKNDIENLVKESVTFHTENWDEVNSKLIMAKIDRTISSINSIAKVLEINTSIQCKTLRQAITLNNFDKSSHVRMSGEEGLITEITDAAYILIDKLDNSFIEKYLSSKHWWLM